ncbi:hypothetical protein CALVIDRAFT_535273 [Calocera viscosa TUFC12733]|uniref:Large ribosomal subunit protein mL54 n=1 Tax=Calocera viscosa (strain TUFC12733) TaxID=1330018 RepID=A0A167PDG9_CALVF|nr:hypothetical protein CALVIDRAFT_535273 [Calocera viscosa TUFC12733]
MTSLWVGTSRSFIGTARAGVRSCSAPRRGIASASMSTAPAKPKVKAPLSSCPSGTVLAGIQYLKDAPPLVAAEDTDYPAWLWTLLDEGAKVPSAKGAKGERQAAVREKKAAAEARREAERRKGESREERLGREEEELRAQRKRLRKENKDRIREQNFMKTT